MTDTLADVARFVLETPPEAIPASALDEAAILMIDTMGIAIASGPMEAGVIARNTANALYTSNSSDMSAKMMFDGRSVSLAGAAFAAATQIDNLDGHDGYAPVKGHIGVAVLPTIAALMQQHRDITGPEAMAQVVIGYEIAGRAGLALHSTVSDYHASGTWNALGVAAIAARMRGLTKNQLRQAMGIAEYHGPRGQVMREIANPTMLHDGSGMGAFVGVSAALMAEQGFTGAPAITIESADVAGAWADLGHDWQVEQQYIKPYPICRWAHGAIDAVRKIVLEHDIQTSQIARINVRSFHEAACLYPSMPQTTSMAQYSLQFAVAAWVVHKKIGLDQISGAGLRDPEVARILNLIEVDEAPQHNARFPSGRWADATVTLTDGRSFESGDVNARGGSTTRLDRSEIMAKYDEFADPVVGKDRAQAIKQVLLEMPSGRTRLADLNDLIFAAP